MNKPAPLVNIEQLIPHRKPMTMIDTIIEKGDKHLIASADLRRKNLFTEPDGRIPSFLGLEYMAQAASAFIGARSLENHQAVKIGFLLGTRKFATQLDYFPNNIIHIRVDAVMLDEEFGVFDCSISLEDKTIIASAQLKAFQPDDISSLFKTS